MKIFFSFLFISQLCFAQSFQKLNIGKGEFFYHSSHPLDKENDLIEKVVITVHGSELNSNTYFNSIEGVFKERNLSESTLVIAPAYSLSPQRSKNELSYSYEGWWIGDESVDDFRVSSFTVIDHLIKTINNLKNFPNLKKVILIGHSAGGHLVQRYALGSKLDIPSLTYIVANPGTYAYLNAYRVNPKDESFYIPRTSCAYNAYKYGLEKLNPYMRILKVEDMIANYLKRNVVYFTGELDTGSSEMSCEASLQGKSRFDRAKKFYLHMDEYFSKKHNHKLIIAEGVGHTQYGMYRSVEGLELLLE